MGDKVSNMALGFLVAVLVARHLGPENFGIFSYAISVGAIFSAASHVGLSGLIVKEIVKKPNERALTLGTALGLKYIGGIVGYTILITYAAIYEGIESIEFTALAIAGGILLLLPFDIIDYWFQAFVRAKYSTAARLTGITLSSALKIVLVIAGSGTIALIAANLTQAIFTAIAFIVIYRLKSELSIKEWSFKWTKAKELFNQGWMIYLGAIFAVIYLKIDLVMLRWYVGAEAVGIYAVAAQLSEAWYFIPTAIAASFFPKLIAMREANHEIYLKRLQQLFDFLFILAVSVAIVTTILSDWLITLFFGSHYIESASILIIHIWAGTFIFMRALFSRWILIENALMFSLITQGLGALTNILLNMVMIPKFGGNGAAFATLISYAVASYVALAFHEKTRPIFYMMSKSIIGPVRYIFNYARRK
jgi:O-antigen/teichoic acid export membrane protein